jgi:hypothetical protein
MGMPFDWSIAPARDLTKEEARVLANLMPSQSITDILKDHQSQGHPGGSSAPSLRCRKGRSRTVAGRGSRGGTPSQGLRDQLSRSVAALAMSCDARDGLDAVAAWLQLHQRGLSAQQGQAFNRRVQGWLLEQQGLLLPGSPTPDSLPDLDPEIFTTRALASKLFTTTDTLKRHARRAWAQGPAPQPLREFPGWFVVESSSPRGGQGCGWKFQQLRGPEAAGRPRD